MLSKQQRLLFKKQAEVIKAMAHPLRLAVLDCLKDGEQCVFDIAEYVGSERSNISRHLAIMSSAGILEQRKDGLKVLYRLKTPCIMNFFKCIGGVLKEQIEENKSLMSAIR